MHLDHITELLCPVCNAKPSSELKRVQHGVSEEIREFRCGASIVWSSHYNGMHPHASRPCPVDPIVLARENRRESAANKLRKTVDELKVDDEFKKMLLERLHPSRIGY